MSSESTAEIVASQPVRRSQQETIADALRCIIFPGSVFEIRALGCTTPEYRRPHDEHGYYDFDHINDAAAAAVRLGSASGNVYFTFNPVNPDLLSRRANRVDVTRTKEPLTHDIDIACRWWMLIDCDPIRSDGISSTTPEWEASRDMATAIKQDLSRRGWPEPIRCRSGNGCHLLYRVDLPSDDASTALVKECLQALHAKHTSSLVKVDTKVSNAARITKLYGTKARKGDNTTERPHRFSGMEKAPEPINVVSVDLLQRLAADAPKEPTGKRNHPLRSLATKDRSCIVDRASKYAATIDAAISNGRGHNNAFRGVCKVVRGFGLTAEEAFSILAPWNQEKCQPPWSDTELRHKIDEAISKGKDDWEGLLNDRDQTTGIDHLNYQNVTIGPFGDEATETIGGELQPAPKLIQLTNYREEFVANDKPPRKCPLPMSVMLATTMQATGGWPKRVGGTLFVNPRPGVVQWLGRTSSLFGYIGTAAGIPSEFLNLPGFHSRDELYAELQRNTEGFNAVESLPHEPPLPDHYYACPEPTEGDGQHLAWLLDRFSPSTEIDRDLIQAAIVTLFWGGAGGTRPAFVFTSDSGRGSGKTKAATIIADIANGFMEVSSNEEIGIIKQRLLSEAGRSKRIIMLDNIKSLRFSWAELEALITSPTISGKQLYVGDAERPNMLTWFVTLNGVSMSTDLAQRSCIIKLAKPKFAPTWEEETRAYVREHRTGIIGDIVAFLRSPRATLDACSRWGAWERDIIARLPEPSDAQRVIAERQTECDIEQEESELLEEFFAKKLTEIGYAPDRDRVFVPNDLATQWFNWCHNEKVKTASVSRILRQQIQTKQIHRIVIHRSGKHGRGYEWVGPNWSDADTEFDIEKRIAINLAAKKSIIGPFE